MASRKTDDRFTVISFLIAGLLFNSCASTKSTYHDSVMDFGAVQSVAVMPFANLSTDKQAAERVRDVFTTHLLATESMYVLPAGEIARGISRVGVSDPTAPSGEEIKRLAGIIKVNAVITGTVREYGAVRSATTSANVISLSMTMIEAETGKVVWTASSTKGGITLWDRLFGGGGEPMNDITEEAVVEILDKLFQ